jgi:HK97 family phage major capsid protein
MTDPQTAPETKAFARDAEARFFETLEAFRAANDERLTELERRMSEDAVTAEKVDRINASLTEQKAALDRLSLDMRRPAQTAAPESRAASTAFQAYVRKGDAHGLARLDTKSLSTLVDADGGYLAPDETSRLVEKLLSEISPIRAIAGVQRISGNALRLPVAVSGFASGWAAETAARPQTATADIAVADIPAMEMYAMPAATQSLLDDALVNVEQWIAEEVQHAFAAQEGAAFVSGDGVAKPKGFLAYDKVADASWQWGKLGYVPSGAAGDFAASDPADALIDLAYAPKQAYRANARWVMNRATEAKIRKLKDGDGSYLWQPGTEAAAPATLLGYPVTVAEDMPDIVANSFAVAFGDFRSGYLVADRAGVRVLRDPYSAKPYVLFYTTKRVGGAVRNFEAIKLMRFAAS